MDYLRHSAPLAIIGGDEALAIAYSRPSPTAKKRGAARIRVIITVLPVGITSSQVFYPGAIHMTVGKLVAKSLLGLIECDHPTHGIPITLRSVELHVDPLEASIL